MTVQLHRSSRSSTLLVLLASLASSACGGATRLELHDGRIIEGEPQHNDRRSILMWTERGAVLVCKRDVRTADVPGTGAVALGVLLALVGTVGLVAAADDDNPDSGDKGFCEGCAPIAIGAGVAVAGAGLARWLPAESALGLGSPPHPPCDPEAP